MSNLKPMYPSIPGKRIIRKRIDQVTIGEIVEGRVYTEDTHERLDRISFFQGCTVHEADTLVLPIEGKEKVCHRIALLHEDTYVLVSSAPVYWCGKCGKKIFEKYEKSSSEYTATLDVVIGMGWRIMHSTYGLLCPDCVKEESE